MHFLAPFARVLALYVHSVSSDYILHISLQLPLQPTSAVIVGIDVLLSVRISLPFHIFGLNLVILDHIRPLSALVRATMHSSTSLTALEIF